MLKIENKKRFTAFALGVVFLISALIFGAYKSYKYFTRTKTFQEISFSDAGKNGEKKTYQVVIKINKNTSDSKSEPQRGDIIMTAPEDKQWSIAEQEGFLIIKINLTPDQAALLIAPKEIPDMKNIKDSKSAKTPAKPIDSSRRFAVDLAKIGISPDEERGKVISDKVFEGQDVIVEKK
jgi:hypothetical protein